MKNKAEKNMECNFLAFTIFISCY